MKKFIEKMNEMFQENGYTSDGRVVVEELDTDNYKITVLENSTTINTKDLTDYGIMMEIMETVRILNSSEIDEIEKTTGCAHEQAIYLYDEFSKLPKVKDLFLNNLSKINLYNCDTVEVVRCYGYMDDTVNIVGKRINKKKSFELLGEKRIWHDNYVYHLSSYLNEVSLDVY